MTIAEFLDFSAGFGRNAELPKLYGNGRAGNEKDFVLKELFLGAPSSS
jgi:hypothetical protein